MPDTVSLTTEQSSYAPTATIVVLIHNRRNTPIYAYDHQSGCSVITLHRQVGGHWQKVGDCRMGRATRLVTIPANQVTRVRLPPGAGAIKATPWPSGAYQAVLSYRTTATGTGDVVTLTTPVFRVA